MLQQKFLHLETKLNRVRNARINEVNASTGGHNANQINVDLKDASVDNEQREFEAVPEAGSSRQIGHMH